MRKKQKKKLPDSHVIFAVFKGNSGYCIFWLLIWCRSQWRLWIIAHNRRDTENEFLYELPFIEFPEQFLMPYLALSVNGCYRTLTDTTQRLKYLDILSLSSTYVLHNVLLKMGSLKIRSSTKKSIIFSIDDFSKLCLGLCKRLWAILNGSRKTKFCIKKTI